MPRMIAPRAWRPMGVGALEPGASLAATTLGKSVVVSANPGSGKTELLAQRADFLFRTGACRYPKKILAISFKTDAARTLQKRVRDRSGADFAHRLDSATFHAFAKRLITIYRPLLPSKQTLDVGFGVGTARQGTTQVAFKELLPLAKGLVDAHPMIGRSVNMAYDYVFLDEFQDCTTEQYGLITSLFLGTGISVVAVGDAKQQIMGWAGALAGIMQTFADDFDALSCTLVQNWRSAPAIRRVQNRMAAVMEPRSAVAPDSIVGDEGEVDLLQFDDETQEAQRIAQLIEGWIDRGTPPHEIAILHARQPVFFNEAINAELERRGIAFRNEHELQDLASEPLSDFLINFLLVIGDAPSPNAYASTLNALAFGDEDGQGRWIRALNDARSAVASAPAREQGVAALDQLDLFLASVPRTFLLSLSNDYDDARVDALARDVCQTLRTLMDQSGGLDGALARYRDEGAVRVMTIHKCKGMEFECVIVPCTEEETWWGDLEENRCSYYVAVSRAKSRLVVSCAARRARPEGFPNRWSVSRRAHAEFLGYLR